MMDVVYPYRSAPEDFELRYSLRSLVNISHCKVIIAGDRPAFAGAGLQCIPVEQNTDRFRDSTANILAAATEGDVTDEFIVMHDDIFVLEPWEFRHQHRCTMREYIASHGPAGDYRHRAMATRDILKAHGVVEPLWFGLHTPTIYDRDKLIGLIHEFDGQPYLLRTLYHNLFPAPSERASDVKVRDWDGRKPSNTLSTSDGLVRDRGFRKWIEARFPDRSPYEHHARGRCLILGYGQNVWNEAYAAMGPFEAVIASPEAAAHRNAPGWLWGDVTATGNTDAHCLHLAWQMGFDADQVVFCGKQELGEVV